MSTSPHSKWIRANALLPCALLLLLAVVVSVAAVWEPTAQAESRFFDTTLKENALPLQGWLNEYLVNSSATRVETVNPLEVIQVPVYFHVIRASNGTGDVPESTLDAQINVLNNAFNGATTANIQFFFWKAGVTRTSNNAWFNMQYSGPNESATEHEAKRTLRQGGANVLNFYTISANPQPGATYPNGWAPLPSDYAGNSCRDGVVVPFTTLPGDTNPNNPFNAGDLPVHEVGHWLGLFHTHQGSCTGSNDQVSDTPAHVNQFVGECPPVTTDTCPSSPGTDPIHNYMTDYSDQCKSEFTPGQFQRMRDQYVTFRQSSTAAPSCPVVTMSVSDATVTEGNSGTTGATFTVTLSRTSTQTIRVSFASASGTATSGVDFFSGAGGTLSFAPGQLSQSFFINVIGDTTAEPNESFFVNLSNSTNATISDGQGVGTIINDDGNPVTYYEIVARHSGKCLDVAGGSTTSGAMLTQWTCVGVQNQHFRIVSVGGGYSKIIARHSGKVLDVQWGSMENGAPVWQMDENGTPAQQWQIIDVGGGYSRIMARHSGKALDVAGGFMTNGTQVHQWDYVGITNQQWRIRAVP